MWVSGFEMLAKTIDAVLGGKSDKYTSNESRLEFEEDLRTKGSTLSAEDVNTLN